MEQRKLVMGSICLFCAGLLLLSAIHAGAAEKESFPRKPITYIIPMEPGSSMDSTGRPFCEAWQKELGQPIMIVNKPGAAGTIGQREVFNAKPDGYTIGQANSVHYAKFIGLIKFDHRDMSVIGIPNAGVPAVWCAADRPWKTIKELVDYAKAHPGQVKAATASRGGYWWMATKVLERAAGIQLNVLAQPGGGGMAITQLAGGHVDLAICGTPEASAQLRAGTIRLLAVFGKDRVPGYDAPSLVESGINADILGINSVVAPKGIPQPVYEVLTKTFQKAVNNQEFLDFLVKLGAICPKLAGEEAAKYLDQQAAILKPIIQDAGMMKAP